jgi:hypothetical protein
MEIGVRIEVKHLSCNFTSEADWPFPDFMVCSAHSYDAADPKPWRYFYLNKNKTHAGVLRPANTHQFWRRERRQVSNHGSEPQELYVCDPQLVSFINLLEE